MSSKDLPKSKKHSKKTGRGSLVNFKRIANAVIAKLIELKECKKAVSKAILDLSKNSESLIEILDGLEQSVTDLERKRRLWQTAGVAATTLGSTVAAALWAMAYVDYDNFSANIAMGATAVGIGGAVIKTATWYLSSRSNKAYLTELEGSLSSETAKELSGAEVSLNGNMLRMIEILKEFYGGSTNEEGHGHDKDGEGKVRSRRVTEEGEPASPLLISVMETADTAACAPDVIDTLLDYSADLGFESLEALEQTYDAATASLGEVISYGLLEGASNGLSVVLSTYEIYRLIGSWNRENPTVQKIQELVTGLRKKQKVYRDTQKSIQVVDYFMKLRLRKYK